MANLLVKFDNGHKPRFYLWLITIIFLLSQHYRHGLVAFVFIVKKKRSEFTLIFRTFIFFYAYFTSNSTLSNNFFSGRCYHAISQPFQPLVGLSVERKIR